MDETTNTPAIIISRQDYRENDVLVIAYTLSQGRLQLVARGAKKSGSKLAGHIEPLTLADIMVIRGRGYDYLGSAVTRDAYHNLRSDLNKLYFAGQAVNIYRRYTEESQEDTGLFYLLADWLDFLDTYATETELSKEKGELLLAILIFYFLSQTGHKPQIYRCAVCKLPSIPGGNFFDLAAGSLICGSCHDKQKLEGKEIFNYRLAITDDSIKAIKFIIDSDLRASLRLVSTKKVAKELLSISNNLLNFVKA